MTVLHSLAFLLLLGALNGVMSVFSLSPWWMWGVEFALVGMLAAMAGLSWLVAGYERYCWYEVDSWDCMGMEEASFLEEDWR